MNLLRQILAGTVLAAAIAAPAFAKVNLDIVTVAGPDWFGEIELTGSNIPESLILGGFFDPQKPISPPADLGHGYLITRGYDEGGERHMFDRMVYFPGAPGYVYYLEIIGGSGPYDGAWFAVEDGEGEALLSALAAEGVYFPAETALQDPAVVPQPLDLMPAFGIGLAILVGGIAGWVLRAARDRTRLARIA